MRIRQDGHTRDPGQDLLQEFHPLAGQFRTQVCQAGDVSAWPREARHEPALDGIAYDRHHDGDCGCGLARRLDRRPGGDDNVHLEADQLGCEGGEPFGSSLRPAVLDADVSPLDVTELVQALPEWLGEGIGRRTDAQETDAGYFYRLLRFAHERRHQYQNQGEGSLLHESRYCEARTVLMGLRLTPRLGGVSGSSNHLVGAQQDRFGDGDVECLGGLEIDDKFELRGLLDREVGRLGTFQDSVDIAGGAASNGPYCSVHRT